MSGFNIKLEAIFGHIMMLEARWVVTNIKFTKFNTYKINKHELFYINTTYN